MEWKIICYQNLLNKYKATSRDEEEISEEPENDGSSSYVKSEEAFLPKAFCGVDEEEEVEEENRSESEQEDRIRSGSFKKLTPVFHI